MAVVSVLSGCVVLLVLTRSPVQVVGAGMSRSPHRQLLALDVGLFQVRGWGPALTAVVPGSNGHVESMALDRNTGNILVRENLIPFL